MTSQKLKPSKEVKELFTGICKKVYDVGGEPAVKIFFESKFKEFPPLKLSKKEMEFLSGGKGKVSIDDFDAGALVGIVVSAAAAGAAFT